MTLNICSADLNYLKKHTESCLPEEACALLVGRRLNKQNWRVTGIEITENVADDKVRNFEIDPQKIINLEMKYLRQDKEIVGIFHSHPEGSATPSATDKKSMIDNDVFWLIANTISGSVSEFCAYTVSSKHDFQELRISPT
jgi:proteasome lid subunit RPN8/RPN11